MHGTGDHSVQNTVFKDYRYTDTQTDRHWQMNNSYKKKINYRRLTNQMKYIDVWWKTKEIVSLVLPVKNSILDYENI